MAKERYQRLAKLYIRGATLEFPNGVVMWVQVMNPLEADDASEEAKTAKARLVMALKEIGSDEQAKAFYEFSQLPRQAAVNAIVGSQHALWMAKADVKLRDDPEWKERLEIIDRQQAIQARPSEDAERQLLDRIVGEYMTEIYRRVDEEADFERDKMMKASEEDVRDRWLELYRERRGNQAAFNEHQATAAWYGARVCEAVRDDDGEWDHSKCGDHELRVYDDKADFRSQPDEIQNAILNTLLDLSMSSTEAKNSDSAENSSDSSALQSPPEESTLSTPTATLSEPLGTSTPLSSTP